MKKQSSISTDPYNCDAITHFQINLCVGFIENLMELIHKTCSHPFQIRPILQLLNMPNANKSCFTPSFPIRHKRALLDLA